MQNNFIVCSWQLHTVQDGVSLDEFSLKLGRLHVSAVLIPHSRNSQMLWMMLAA